MSDAIDSKKISRRSIVAGIAALGVYGFARNARAAETRPLAERLAVRSKQRGSRRAKN